MTMHTDKQPVYLVDASIYVFRSWFSVSDTVTDCDGNPANAVYGFCEFVTRLLREKAPCPIVFAFDESFETSFRNQIYPPYKANREPAPAELKAQFQMCREFVAALGISEISDPLYEADDLIGTLSAREKAKGHSIVVVSGDKDLAQVVGEGDYFWNYAQRVLLDYDGICEKFGVYPEQIADMLALAGDPVDNIPGVPGIGTVTAVRLLRHFGSLSKIFENPDEVGTLKIRGAKRIEASLREYSETVRLARRLTEIYCDVDIPADCATAVGAVDGERLERFLDRLAFGDWRRRQCRGLARTLSGD